VRADKKSELYQSFRNSVFLKNRVSLWLSDQYFYDKLTEREKKEFLRFDKLKEFIDAESLPPGLIPLF